MYLKHQLEVLRKIILDCLNLFFVQLVLTNIIFSPARGTLDSETPNAAPPISVNDVAGLWASYHSALGLSKSSPPREQSVGIYII